MSAPNEPGASRQAEKDYLRRSGSAEWERVKPFAPRGATPLHEGAALIQDFGAVLALLGAQPHHHVLDFGAGAGWAADWLQRLGLSVVAVDLSHDLLAIGRDRLRRTGPARVACGDGEALPFASASFDRVVCLNAMHHIPDVPRALAEIHRVLRGGGRAVFSEPGSGHASQAHALRAVQDFGVQEADIDADTFLEQCRAAGFPHVVLEPFAHVVPGHGLTAGQWRAWRARAAEGRPRRALRTVWRGLLELAGLRKHDEIVAETFASEALRVLHAAMRDHPIVVASTEPLDRFLDRRGPAAPGFRAAIRVIDAPAEARAGSQLTLSLELLNAGSETWRASTRLPGHVRVGIQWLGADRRLLERDFARAPLSADVPSGGAVRASIVVQAPPQPGTCFLKIDLVSEGVSWFEAQGSVPAVAPLNVI